jgi:hypothetical protein
MNKISLRLAAMGTAAALVAASLVINAKPASAGSEEFWGSVLGGFLGALSGDNRGERQNYSSKEVRTAAKQMLMHYGLNPIDECTVNVVLVSIGSEQICAMPNHVYGPGTYTVHPETKQLLAYGMTAQNSYQQPQPAVYPQQPQPTVYLQQPQPAVYPQQPQPAVYPQQPQPTVYPQQPQPTVYPQTQQVISVTHQSPSSFAGNSAFYRLSGQTISPPVLARLRSLLAGNNIAEAACGTTAQQVTITVNNEFVICGHSNNQYAPGNYSFTLNGLY